MADSDPALLFAQYKIKEKIGMTPDLLLGSEFQQLAFKPLPTVNLAKEYELVAQYEDWKRQQEEMKARAEEMRAADAADVTSAAVGITSSSSGTTQRSSTDLSSVPPPKQLVRSLTAEDIAASQELAVQEMIAETKESKDVCIFYLESTNWDLQAAVELFRSMQIR